MIEHDPKLFLEAFLEPLEAGVEESLYFVIQIEKPDAQKLPNFFTDRRFPDASNACQKYAHLYILGGLLYGERSFIVSIGRTLLYFCFTLC
jgi:hypothetical protein